MSILHGIHLVCTHLACTSGTFGADCKQTCHCATGVTCDIATGDCGGLCEIGWTGDNCQGMQFYIWMRKSTLWHVVNIVHVG